MDSRSAWSHNKEDYVLQEVIGCGATAIVQAALCIPRNERVAIKRIDLEKCGASIDEMQKEIHAMSLCHHENVVNYYTSFVVTSELWIIMKLLEGGSMLDIIKYLIKNNKVNTLEGVLDEVIIATVLKEVLKGLEYFHENGQIHRDVKAGNILIGSDGTVQLADFGVSSVIYDFGDRSKPQMRTTFVGTPCWMAPEVMEQVNGYDHKADLWSFGITALELATGTAPYAKFPAIKVILTTLNQDPPTLETCSGMSREGYKKYSRQFRKMIAVCLRKEPSQRPDAKELLKHKFFKQAKNKEYLVEHLLPLAPPIGDRGNKSKRMPGSSGRLYLNDTGQWEWSDHEDNTKDRGAAGSPQQPEVHASSADVSQVPTSDSASSVDHHPEPSPEHEKEHHAPSTPAQMGKVYNVNLRLRNANKELNDIRFQFASGKDSADGIAQELLAADLIDGQDKVVVAANLSKLIENPPESRTVTFALKSAANRHDLLDEKQFFGFAQLTLEV